MILQREIEILKRLLLSHGAMVEDAIAKAIHALKEKDEELARSVIQSDKEIDMMEVRIEEECLKILALHQPVAHDLRFVISVMKINHDLERMGDQASSIAKRAIYISTHQMLDLPLDFPKMAEKSQSMVKRALDSLVNEDPQLAREIIKDDDEIDAMRKKIDDVVMNEIQIRPGYVEHLLKLSAIARHLERLGDMATQIAEDVIYLAEGEIIRHQEMI